MNLDKPGGAACLDCPCKDAPLVPPEPARSERVRLAIVGEAPFGNDIAAKRPFASRGGQMLERGLSTIGLSRTDVHWTNAVLCECKKDDLRKAAKQCSQRLRDELHAVRAPAIMPVGSWAIKSVLNPKSARVQDWRGSISAIRFVSNQKGIITTTIVSEQAKAGAVRPNLRELPRLASGHEFSYVLPTLHPAFVMRDPAWAPWLEIDVARVGRVLNDRWVAPEHEPNRQLFICEENLDALDMLRENELATDVETSGLGCMSTNLVCFVISDRRISVIIPWSRDLRGEIPWWADPRMIASKLTDFWRTRVAVTHNGYAFDHPIFERHGIHLKAKADTLVGAHALASHLPKKLSHVATTYLDVPPWKQFGHGESLQRMWGYCGADGLYTILSHHAQQEELH